MTAPVTGITPVFGLEYLVQGEPAKWTRQKLQRNAEQIEAALVAGPASPPGASDLLVVSGRVSVLEAVATARAAPASPTFSSGWAQFTSAPYGEVLRCTKISPTEVKVNGIITATALTTAGTTVNLFTLPVGYRPAVSILRIGYFQTASSAPVIFRLNITTAGIVQVLSHVAIAIGQWINMCFDFRTVNT